MLGSQSEKPDAKKTGPKMRRCDRGRDEGCWVRAIDELFGQSYTNNMATDVPNIKSRPAPSRSPYTRAAAREFIDNDKRVIWG